MTEWHPAVWVISGGGGALMLMKVVRLFLKQYGEIPVDQTRSKAEGARAKAEGAIHDAYRDLIENLRAEVGRLHTEVTRIKMAVDDCERRHHARDQQDDIRSNEMRALTNQLRDRGVL